jgi:hypothetical protein
MRTSKMPLSCCACVRQDGGRRERRRSTYVEKGREALAFEIARALVRVLGPDLLERAHLLARHVPRAAGHLEHVGEVLDDHTGEHVHEYVLCCRSAHRRLREEREQRTMLSTFHAMKSVRAHPLLPQSVSG